MKKSKFQKLMTIEFMEERLAQMKHEDDYQGYIEVLKLLAKT